MKAVAQVGACNGADLRALISRITDFQLRQPVFHQRGHFIVDAGFDDDPLGGDTGLAGIDDARQCQRVCSFLKIGICKHDGRVGATKLEHGRLDRRARNLGHFRAAP